MQRGENGTEAFSVSSDDMSNGMMLSPISGKGETEGFYKASVTPGHEPDDSFEVVLFRDRVFWPCDMKWHAGFQP